MATKRKRSTREKNVDLQSESEVSYEEVAASDEEIDVFSSLTGAKKSSKGQSEEPEDEEELIRESMAKKRAKDGTELLRKIKGKTKMVKGEVGGGSFQSMGKPPLPSQVLVAYSLLKLFNHGYFDH